MGEGKIQCRDAGQGSSGCQPDMGTTSKVDVDLLLAVKEPGEFADRQPVPERNRPAADEARHFGIENRPFDRPADRIGPVEQDHRNAGLGTREQALLHGPDERVDPRADVLQVDHEAVEAAKHVGERPPRAGVQAVDRQIQRLVAAVRRLDHVRLLLAPQAVLRREEGRKLAGKSLGQHIARKPQPGIDRRLVQEQTEPRPGRERGRRRLNAAVQTSEKGVAHSDNLVSCGTEAESRQTAYASLRLLAAAQAYPYRQAT